ncbi:MAG: hypothetical protein ABEH77_06320, partial [Halobacteriaceae archaeon]
MSYAARLPDLRPGRWTLAWGLLLVLAEAALSARYVLRPDILSVRATNLVFPWVWVNVSLWVLLRTDTPAATRRTRSAGVAVAAGYFVVLAAVGGVLGPGHLLHGHTHATGVSLSLMPPPGWGPIVFYSGALVDIALVPYKIAGYAALAYLVYATVLEASGAVGALVGLFSCVSCTWPVLGTVLAGVLGGGSAVAAFAAGQPYVASTAVFLSAVALL